MACATKSLSYKIIKLRKQEISGLSGVCYKISLLQEEEDEEIASQVSVACATKSLSYSRALIEASKKLVSVACATKSLSYDSGFVRLKVYESQWRVLQNLSLT